MTVVTRPFARDKADGPRTTCSGEATPSPFFPVRAWRTRYLPSTIHLDDVLRRRLPVALAAWAEGPSEGHALVGMMREFPSSASLVHPFVIGALGARSGESSRPNADHRSRPPSVDPSAKKNRVSEIRVLSTASGPSCAHRSLDVTANGSVSPHAAPTEGALRNASATVPSGDDEPRRSKPWLGRASAFFTNRAA